MPATLLSDRGVVEVSGAEARAFLQGLVTCNMDAVSESAAQFGALLTPQGKIITDFIISQQGDSFFLDTPLVLMADLFKRLRLYKLRAQITLTERTDLAVGASWPEGSGIADPRDRNLGWRLIAPRPQVELLGQNEAAYEALRVSVGVPKGGVDFAYGDAFPHDVNMDLIGGVDFRKGCYVGQEVVSRVQHRGTARRRILRVELTGPAEPGTPVMAGEIEIGTLGSSAGTKALASIRTDKWADAKEVATPVTIAGMAAQILAL